MENNENDMDKVFRQIYKQIIHCVQITKEGINVPQGKKKKRYNRWRMGRRAYEKLYSRHGMAITIKNAYALMF
jgi:hypothetical protein